jgi:RNase P/RNase MRP subunit p29
MRKLAAILLVFLALGAPLSADTAAFPKYDSVFTITVPEDMTVKVDSDAMVLRMRDTKDLASFVFIELSSSEAHDSESARKFVGQYVESKLRALAIEVTRRSPVAEESLNDRIKGFAVEAEGKKGDLRILYTATAFSFDQKRYFLMVSLRDYTNTADNTRNKALKESVAASTLAAGTVGFPKDKAAFTVALPKGWKANIRGDGSLLISATTGTDISTLWDFALKGLSMHGDATMKGFAQSRAEEITKDLNFTDLKCTKPPSEMTIAANKAFITTYEGRMKGKPFFFDLAIFSVDGMHYFYVFGLTPQSTGKPALEHQHDIIASIKAAKE